MAMVKSLLDLQTRYVARSVMLVPGEYEDSISGCFV